VRRLAKKSGDGQSPVALVKATPPAEELDPNRSAAELAQEDCGAF
jgi:hypothetical protein